MKKFFQLITSMPFMGFLLLIFAFAMAIATFVESNYGTPAAKALIYNAHWFELIFLLLGFNLLVNYIRFKNYRWKKFSVGIFHLSFIVIVLGAGITRYLSYEGIMHIREGDTTNRIISTESYFTVKAGEQEVKEKVLFSEVSYKEVRESMNIAGKAIDIKSVGFVKNAVRTPVEHPTGTPMIDFVVSTGQGMQEFTFSPGEHLHVGSTSVGFNEDAAIRFTIEEDKLFINTDIDLELRSMAGGESVPMPAGSREEVKTMHLYAFGDYLILVKKYYPKAIIRVTRSPSGNSVEDAVIVEISDGIHKSVVNVFGRAGQIGNPTSVSFGGTNLELTYGSELLNIPFALRLKDFQLERYIGSESPSSFASEIELIDKERNLNKDVRIFMNNTLKYRGYRFYQSSYDQDELGTVLSVNKDFLGTLVTYIGYFLMTLGMIIALIDRNSYFQTLVRHLKELNKKSIAIIIFAIAMFGGNLQANEGSTAGIPSLDKQLVTDFSELWVHGRDGRIEPMSTLSGEILRKLNRKSKLNGMSSDEVILSMKLYPDLWKTVSFLKIDKKVAVSLGVQGKYASVSQLFDLNGHYRIADQVKAAYAKVPAFRNKLDKAYINLDERVNICFLVFNGDLLTMFPPSNQTDPWWSAGSNPTGLPSADSLFVNRSFDLLLESLNPSADLEPRQILATITAYQKKFGTGILPSDSKHSAEMIYNKFQPLKRIFPWYLSVGFVLLFIMFVNIFRQKQMHKLTKGFFNGVFSLIFLIHTGGLILRWYISGHAPWSNGYESMVYVAWAAMLAGFIFGRKYMLVVGTGSFLAGLTLFVAHLNWMNPEITTLVPVLKSYWLLIHVAIITASYGFLGLSAFLGILVLILYALMSDKNQKNINYFTDQLTTISEMSVILGLYLLTIGTFLGGIWANESWGRYWGWDPKETWALITIVVYAFVGHMRFIPSLKGRYNYNLAAVIAFTSVLMTYFGVNYFLSGLHSYGRGSADGVHWAVYVSGGIIAALAFISYSKFKKYESVEE